MAWAGLGDICSGEGDEGWVGTNWSETKACSLRVHRYSWWFLYFLWINAEIQGCGTMSWLAVVGDWGCCGRCLSDRWCRKGSCRTSLWGEGLLWDAGAVEHLLLSLVFQELCVCCGRDRVDF